MEIGLFTFIFFLFMYFLFFKVFIFRERRREGERQGEKHQWVVASHVAPSGDLARSPGMCSDWESNRRPFGTQPMPNPLSYTSQDYFDHFFSVYPFH